MSGGAPIGLEAVLPALLDMLGIAGTAIHVVADRGNGFERVYVNKPGAAMFGYELEEFLTRPVIDIVVPEQRAYVIERSARHRAGEAVPLTFEFSGMHKDGSYLGLAIASGHLRIPDGIVYVLGMRDVAMFQRAQMSLLEADRIGLVGALASGFAHEINNPLTSVLLNLRSLRKQLVANLPEPVQPMPLRCLEDITTGAERIASCVRALQTLATRGATRTVDVAAVVSSALRLAAPTLEPRAHVIRQIVPVRPVTGEESRIGQAVLAMMLFSSSGFDGELATSSNRIIVAVEERASEIVVEVSDNGANLTTEDVRGAFDPFFRSSARGAGVGVGLGVARSVATTLGGEVTLAPRTGGGAVITMKLPAAG